MARAGYPTARPGTPHASLSRGKSRTGHSRTPVYGGELGGFPSSLDPLGSAMSSLGGPANLAPVRGRAVTQNAPVRKVAVAKGRVKKAAPRGPMAPTRGSRKGPTNTSAAPARRVLRSLDK